MSEPKSSGDPHVAALEAEILAAEAEAAEARAQAAIARAEAAKAKLAALRSENSADAPPTETPPAETPAAENTDADTTGAETTAAEASEPDIPEPAPQSPQSPGSEAAPEAQPSASSAEPDPSALRTLIREGYPQQGDQRIVIGGLVENGSGVPDAQIAIPLSILNRHGLIAGATGTGKTRTLQGLAEGMSDAGIPVFLADIKGDLTGLAVPGTANDRIVERTESIGQSWVGREYPVEFYSLGGIGQGVPLRTTVTDFGPLLLSKVLSLNETQESSLALIFAWADSQGLDLIDLKDLQATISFLTGEEGKAELKGIGGVSSATAGVILRKISALATQGGDVFFGEPAFHTADLLRTAADGRGIISALELPELHDRPALFSTFLMWLLADLFSELPEVGDTEKPKLVFFFDEAHLLFNGASKEFLNQVVQTVRLIRSKGVGIFFVTQSPQDLPSEVLAQLGSRVQHALRAHTPADAKALRLAVSTYPHSEYDLMQVLPALPTGEAIVTVLSEKGAPTPVAWTRIVAPQASMDPAEVTTIQRIIDASPQLSQYGQAYDPESAFEILQAREQARQAHLEAEAAARESAKQAEAAQKEAEKRDRELAQLQEKLQRQAQQASNANRRSTNSVSASGKRAVDSLIRSVGNQLSREITRTLFGTRRR